MKKRLTKEDKDYLKDILEKSHQENNSCSMKKCLFENCWYKLMFKKLNLGKLKNEKDRRYR